MKRILFVVMLVIGTTHFSLTACAELVALEGLPYLDVSEFQFLVKDQLILVLYEAADTIYCAEFTFAGQLFRGPDVVTTVPIDWHANFGEIRLYSTGWLTLVGESQEYSDVDFIRNRTRLIFEYEDSFGAITLDSGATHQEIRNDSLHANGSFKVGHWGDPQFFASWVRYGYRYDPTPGIGWEVRDMVWLSFASLEAQPVRRNVDCGSVDESSMRILVDPNSETCLGVMQDSQWPSDSVSISICRIGLQDEEMVGTWENCLSYFALSGTPYLLSDQSILLVNGPSPILRFSTIDFNDACAFENEDTLIYDFALVNQYIGVAAVERLDNQFWITRYSVTGELLAPRVLWYSNPTTHYVRIAQLTDYGTVPFYVVENGIVYFDVRPWDEVSSSPEPPASLPTNLSLSAYPNPFNSTVTISYELPTAGNAQLKAYDLQGRLVSTISDEFAPAGTRELRWSPENLASGVYFLNLETPVARATQKILYLK